MFLPLLQIGGKLPHLFCEQALICLRKTNMIADGIPPRDGSNAIDVRVEDDAVRHTLCPLRLNLYDTLGHGVLSTGDHAIRQSRRSTA